MARTILQLRRAATARNLRAVALCCAALLAAPSWAGAATITFTFTGTVSGIYGPSAFATDSGILVGDPVTGTWSYRTDAPLGGVIFDDPNLGFTINVRSGALVVSYDGTNPFLTINYGRTDSNSLSVADHTFSGTTGSMTGTVFPSTYAGSSAPAEWHPEQASIYSPDISGSPLPGTLAGISPSIGYTTLIGPNSHTGAHFVIAVTSVRFTGGGRTPVPEPAPLALLACGLVVAGRHASRRRNSGSGKR